MGKHKHISLATRLKDLRRARNWTQQDLSRASGLTRSYISRLEMGDIALPSSEKLRALSQSLGTAPDDLLQAAGYIDDPAEASELPDLKIYLRRKYGIQDPQVLQAVDTIILSLGSPPSHQNGEYELAGHGGRTRGNSRKSTPAHGIDA